MSTGRENFKNKLKEGLLIQTVRLAVGSGAAILAASALKLEFSTSAGMIALLTILTTKWETLKLSAARILTFFMAVLLAWMILGTFKNDSIAFGVLIFVLIMVSEAIGWRVTVSVNAVIGTHFLAVRDFSIAFIMNEFFIVLIGITVAILMNLFQNNGSQKNKIIKNMRYTEQHFKEVLEQLAGYLMNNQADSNVWKDLGDLESALGRFKEQAYLYQNNTFQAHTSYYSQYFEMRASQCAVLYHLHSEMEKLKELPRQAEIIADFIVWLVNYITEMNIPDRQLNRLYELFKEMEGQKLPKTREEFESRAVLYHILMDLEDFIQYKSHFIERINDRQFQIYWKKEVGDSCRIRNS